MKVTTRVHYGLRAMTELARSYRDGRLVSIAEIARSESLPLAYLEQLVGELRRAGLVEGTRGVRGGYRLATSPTEITVGSVYRVLEGAIAPVECTADDYHQGTCVKDGGCLSRGIWARVQAAILGVLDSTTLEDLLQAEDAPPRLAGFIPLSSLGGLQPAAPPTLAGSFAHA